MADTTTAKVQGLFDWIHAHDFRWDCTHGTRKQRSTKIGNRL